MWLSLLGPLLVRGEGAERPVLPGTLRVVLTALALPPSQVVSQDELIRALWDDDPPPGAAATVRSYVMRLRHALGPAAGGRVITRAPGYLLEAGGRDVDVLIFEGLCDTGGRAVRARDWQRGADLLGEALDLWRGSPLADVPSEVLRREQVPQLEQLWMLTAQRRIEARLNLGQHADLIPELQALIAQHPLREAFHCQFMTALYLAGRRGEALAAYRRARDLLVAELGLEPGEELRQLHQRILAADPELLAATRPWMGEQVRAASPAVPRQLPAMIPHFIGRETELASLDSLLDAGGGGAARICAIGGMAGVGKTALAVAWAHRVASQFPDGQLYMNLQGFGPVGTSMEPAAVIHGFLDALGVGAGRIPVSVQAQAGRYRSLLAGRRMLVVLDNARDEDQVRPLLAGSGSCLVIVTSRTRLTGLAATDGAHLVNLDVLSDEESRAVLAGRLGDGRVPAEPGAVAELAALCGRLPLALAIAAARAADRPGFPLAELTAELTGGRQLAALDAGEATASVQAVFQWSYRQLDPLAAQVFRLLGLHPGPDIGVHAAAALGGLSVAAARELLRGLARGCLLAEPRPDRFVFHDLLRAYAAGQAEITDSAADRHAARTALLDHYVTAAEAAAKALGQPALSAIAAQGGPAWAAREAAIAWLDAERANLTAVAVDAAGSGWPQHAIRLGAALVRYLDIGAYFTDARTVHAVALDAARRAGDRAAEADELRNCVVDFRQGRYDEASGKLRRALQIYRDLDNRMGQGRTLGNLGHVVRQQGRYREAVDQYQRAISLARDVGDTQSHAVAMDGLGITLRAQGQYQAAAEHHLRAMALYQQIGHPDRFFALENLAATLGHLERWQEAADYLDQALAWSRQAHCTHLEAHVFNTLGAISTGQGHHQQAIDHYRQSLALFRELGGRSGEASALNGIGEALTASGLAAEAAVEHDQALTVAAEVNDLYEQARAHSGLAHASAAADDALQARRHWQHAFTLYCDLGCPEASQVHGALQDLDAATIDPQR